MSRLYFAYGSNMLETRIRDADRAPQARFVAVGRLARHSLRFHKRGRDGSGKCDAFSGAASDDLVWGAVWAVTRSDERSLDRVEGLGVGYDKHPVEIETSTSVVRAVTYCARPTHIEDELRPEAWYLELVLEGARELGLPGDYVEQILVRAG